MGYTKSFLFLAKNSFLSSLQRKERVEAREETSGKGVSRDLDPGEFYCL
jgi:hypothetical protein